MPRTNPKAQDKYQLITVRASVPLAYKLLTLMEQGTLPWQKPWFGNPLRNLIGGNPYQGSNPLLLTVQMLADDHQDRYLLDSIRPKTRAGS